jgi:hypothetical protein
MESSKTVTSIFIVVTLVAMVALAISVNQKSALETEPVPTLLPGLSENLGSMERITGFPVSHIRSVRLVRTNKEELAVTRDTPDSPEFQFEIAPPESITPYSTMLFANTSFLDGLNRNYGFSVISFSEETIISELTYSSFDGLILKFIFFRAEDATWLRIIASYSDNLAARYLDTSDITLLSGNEVLDIARSLNGRVYNLHDS